MITNTIAPIMKMDIARYEFYILYALVFGAVKRFVWYNSKIDQNKNWWNEQDIDSGALMPLEKCSDGTK